MARRHVKDLTIAERKAVAAAIRMGAVARFHSRGELRKGEGEIVMCLQDEIYAPIGPNSWYDGTGFVDVLDRDRRWIDGVFVQFLEREP